MKTLDIRKLKDKDLLLIKVENKKQMDSLEKGLSHILKDSRINVKALFYKGNIMIIELVSMPVEFLRLLERRVGIAIRLKERK